MLYHTTFRIDMSRANEWLACLWQGPVPPDLKVRDWLTLTGEPRVQLLLWEGGDEARRFVERVFGSFGEIETRPATSSNGMALAIGRDLAGYERMMKERNTAPAELARQVDLRRRGMEAPTPQAAMAAAQAWAKEA